MIKEAGRKEESATNGAAKGPSKYGKMFQDKISWRVKLVTLFSLVMVGSLLIQLFLVIPYAKDREVEHAEVQQEEIARNIARELDIAIQNGLKEIKAIANLQVFREMDIENQTDVLIQSVEIVPTLSSCMVMNETGWFVSGNFENISAYTTMSFADFEFFSFAFETGEPYFGTPAFYSTTGQVGTSISIPIIDETEGRIGVMIAGLVLNDIIDNVKNYPLEEDQRAFLIDRDATVVAHSGIDLFTLNDGPLALNYSTWLSNHDIFVCDGHDDSHEYERNETTYIGASIVLSSNDWGVVVETEKDAIFSESESFTQSLVLFNIVFFLIIFCITLAIIHQITSDQERMEESLRTHRDTLEEEVNERTKELKRTMEELGRSNKELQQFAYVASHDLQEPLRKVKSFSELLVNRYSGQLDDKADKYISYITSGTTRMQIMINDLLTYSRVSTQIKPFESSSMDRAVNNALENLNYSLKESDATITHDPLPVVHVDISQMTQVFQNIIGNGIKFRGDKKPIIHVSAKEMEDHWQFSIGDNGIGIKSEYAERILVVFERLHSRGEYEGTGIGLAVCKKIVERHGGQIWIESEPGDGSTFHFTIPNRRSDSNE